MKRVPWSVCSPKMIQVDLGTLSTIYILSQLTETLGRTSDPNHKVEMAWGTHTGWQWMKKGDTLVGITSDFLGDHMQSHPLCLDSPTCRTGRVMGSLPYTAIARWLPHILWGEVVWRRTQHSGRYTCIHLFSCPSHGSDSTCSPSWPGHPHLPSSVKEWGCSICNTPNPAVAFLCHT